MGHPETRLEPLDWHGLRLTQLAWQSCNDPRDWKLGVNP